MIEGGENYNCYSEFTDGGKGTGRVNFVYDLVFELLPDTEHGNSVADLIDMYETTIFRFNVVFLS